MSLKFPLVLTATLALVGCDSGLAYRADLGQTSTVPTVTAQLRSVPLATTPLQALSFVAPLPGDWVGATSVKLLVSGQAVALSQPLSGGQPSTASITAASTLSATVPTGTVALPLNGNTASMSFLVNNDHVMVANVTFQ